LRIAIRPAATFRVSGHDRRETDLDLNPASGKSRKKRATGLIRAIPGSMNSFAFNDLAQVAHKRPEIWSEILLSH
jgi:hypothetical protein